MENESQNFTSTYYKTSFKKEDLTKLPTFLKWKEEREKEGKKIVRCPICYSYELFVEPTNHQCVICHKEYCQYCLKPCVEGEIEHDHENNCCSKFCSLIRLMIEEGEPDGRDASFCDKLKVCLFFIFGNPLMLTARYYKFFGDNNIIDNDCVHSFFKYTNLFANFLTSCFIFYITWVEIFFLIFIPSIIPCYCNFIYFNWKFTIENLGVDELPLIELTVRGKGYYMYNQA